MAKAEPFITTSIRKTTHERLMEYINTQKTPPKQVDVISVAVEEYLDKEDSFEKNEDS